MKKIASPWFLGTDDVFALEPTIHDEYQIVYEPAIQEPNNEVLKKLIDNLMKEALAAGWLHGTLTGRFPSQAYDDDPNGRY